jgi:hypothetical protein
MRKVWVAWCVLPLLACDPYGAFTQYCAASGQCTCNGSDCCSLDACGAGEDLGCCEGSQCVSGHCTLSRAALSLNPQAVVFGRFPGLANPPAQTLTLSNTGILAATGVAVQTQISSGSSTEFQIDASACPATLPPGGSCKITVAVVPTVLGLKQAAITVTVANAPPPTTALTATFGELISVQAPVYDPSFSVQSSPPGLDCYNGCIGPDGESGNTAAYFVAGTTLSVTGLGLPRAWGAQWAPPCSSVNSVCTFTVTEDAQLVVNFQPPLTLNVTSNLSDTAYVIVPGNGYCYNGQCVYNVSGPLTLTVTGDPAAFPDVFVMEGWEGACSGTNLTCTLDIESPTIVSVSLSTPNQAFVTGPMPLSGIGTDGSGADAQCAAAARANGDSRTYLAWVASSTRNPAQLLATGAGWVVDEFYLGARDIADVTGARLFYPIQPGGDTRIITGANPDGTSVAPGDNCQNWTSTLGTAPVGTSGGVGYAWSVDVGVPRLGCNGSAWIACFGSGVAGNLVQPPVTPPVAATFLSSPWLPTTGLAGADAQCQADAVSAGLHGTFGAVSLHPINNTLAVVRTDGVLSGDPDNVDANGNGVLPVTLSDTYVWVQGQYNCNAWSGGSGAVGSIARYDHGSTDLVPPTAPCTEAHRLQCLQASP